MTVKIAKIIGPPGTGKTEYMSKQIINDLNIYPPQSICAVSLTNTAVNEFIDRASKATGVVAKKFANFKTVHAMCFRLLGIKKDDLAESANNIAAWNEQASPDMQRKPASNGPVDASINACENPLWSTIQNKRNNLCKKDEYTIEEWNLLVKWRAFLLTNGLVDFTGLMEEVLERGLCPDNISVLYVDECQDLSPLAFEVVKLWSTICTKAVYIGDANQAIYRFAGARPETFLEIEADYIRVLSQSYRVPEKVHKLAQKAISMSSVYDKSEYLPYNTVSGGSVGTANYPDLSLPGTHMIITRTSFSVKKWITWLKDKQVAWHNPYRPSEAAWNITNQKAWKAAKTWITIKGYDLPVTLSELKNLGEHLIGKKAFNRGMKTQLSEMSDTANGEYFIHDNSLLKYWTIDFLKAKYDDFHDFLKLKESETNKYIKMLLMDASLALQDAPTICLGTVHSVKGGQADHVWYDPELSNELCSKLLNPGIDPVLKLNYDDECRVTYVAITRAKESFNFLLSKTGSCAIKNPVCFDLSKSLIL